MTKEDAKKVLHLLRTERNVDFGNLTKRRAQEYINEWAEALEPFSMEEVMKVLPENYIPPIATEGDMARLLKNIIQDCCFNRKSEAEQEAERQKALEEWHKQLKRLYPEYEPKQADRSVEDILGD